jgi:hypothetical protein
MGIIGSFIPAESFAPPTDEAVTMIEATMIEVQKQSGTLAFNVSLDAPTIMGLLGEVRTLRRDLKAAKADPTYLKTLVLPEVDLKDLRATRDQLQEVCLRMRVDERRYFAGHWIKPVGPLHWKLGAKGDHERLPEVLESLGVRIQLQGGQA